MLQETIARFIAAVNAGDLDSAERMLLRDYYGYVPEIGEQSAPEAFRIVYDGIRAGMPDLCVAVSELREHDTEVQGTVTLTGTFTSPLWAAPPDGKVYALACTGTARFVGDVFALRLEGLNLSGTLRSLGVLPTPEREQLKPSFEMLVPEVIKRLMFNGMAMREKSCNHLTLIRVTEPSAHVCEQCVASGDVWPALRMCLVCGFVGCCDQSVNKHMKKHFEATGHPVFRSIQPGESWLWCYEDKAFLGGRHLYP